MTPLALALDGWIALAIVAVAVAFLGVRIVRVFAGGKRGCACPSASTCGAGGPSLEDLRRAAARGAARAARRA